MGSQSIEAGNEATHLNTRADAADGLQPGNDYLALGLTPGAERNESSVCRQLTTGKHKTGLGNQMNSFLFFFPDLQSG